MYSLVIVPSFHKIWGLAVHFSWVSICTWDIFLGSGLHLELVHGLTGLGDIDLVVALHFDSLLCHFSRKVKGAFSGKTTFSFRDHIICRCAFLMSGE